MEWIPICDDEHFARGIKIIPKVGEKVSQVDCLALAYAAALQGAGYVASNPMVGVVAVDKDHQFIGMGAHLRFGEAHAEANLLAHIRSEGISSRLAGATLYCTLEPCSFHGKTPSCAKALSHFPIKRLVYGQKDPNKKVNGRGLKILEEAGILCEEVAPFSKASARLIKPFSWCMTHHQPYVALKLAMSFDGKIGKEQQERFWITGERSRRYGHWLRQLYDGLVVGADTVIVDNPSLDIRHPDIHRPSPVAKVVLDPGGRAFRARPLSEQRLISSRRAGDRVFWVVRKGLHEKMYAAMVQQCEQVGVNLIQLGSGQEGLDLKHLLKTLYDHDVNSVLLEGGRFVWASFLNQKLVQRLHSFQSSKLLGGDALNWDVGLQALENTQLVERSVSPLGSDWIVEADMSYTEEKK